jgi:hypothetical protein
MEDLLCLIIKLNTRLQQTQPTQYTQAATHRLLLLLLILHQAYLTFSKLNLRILLGTVHIHLRFLF